MGARRDRHAEAGHLEALWEHWIQTELEFLRAHAALASIYPEYIGAAAQQGLDVEPVRHPDAGYGPDLGAFWSREFRNIVIA